ncbi:MAG TPA: hypothetical protein VE053_14930 [Allosphingosinicella sp.]|nr:hypothetical protein [Allosphingosinicella sp.]
MQTMPDYSQAWLTYYSGRQKEIIDSWRRVDTRIGEAGPELEALVVTAEKHLQKLFVRVAERDHQNTQVRSDLGRLASNQAILEQKFAYFMNELSKFTATLHRPSVLYGSVKELESLQDSAVRQYKTRGTGAKHLNTDYRDLVRFRLVCDSMHALLITCTQFWEFFFDNVISCKNYYFAPVANSKVRPYRGIHYLIIDRTGFPSEIQIISAVREAVGVLDHKLLYKSDTHGVPDDYVEYVTKSSMCSNLLDFETP